MIACVPSAVRDLEDGGVVIGSLHLLGSQTTLDIPMSASVVAPEHEAWENYQRQQDIEAKGYIVKLACTHNRANSKVFNYISNFSKLRMIA